MKQKQQQQGFTILELLIATTVVSVVLLMVSIMMINIGNLYYKGITQSRIQGNVRSITDELSQRLQLSSNPPVFLTSRDGNTHVICLGDTRYTYVIGKQVGGDVTKGQVNNVLWRDTIDSGGCPTPEPLEADKDLVPDNFFGGTGHTVLGGSNQLFGSTGNGTELIAPHSRLIMLYLSPASPYTVGVDVAYGDDNLLCDAYTAGDCDSTDDSTHIWNPNPPKNIPANNPSILVLCKGKSGDSFCATANLVTIVVQRLN